jgi:hypothetical protein
MTVSKDLGELRDMVSNRCKLFVKSDHSNRNEGDGLKSQPIESSPSLNINRYNARGMLTRENQPLGNESPHLAGPESPPLPRDAGRCLTDVKPIYDC